MRELQGEARLAVPSAAEPSGARVEQSVLVEQGVPAQEVLVARWVWVEQGMPAQEDWVERLVQAEPEVSAWAALVVPPVRVE